MTQIFNKLLKSVGIEYNLDWKIFKFNWNKAEINLI